MKLEKQKAFLIHFLYFSLILGLVYISFKFLLPVLMPFVIGMAVALILRPLIDRLEKKFRIKRSLVSVLVLLIFFGVLILLVSLCGVRVFTFLQEMFYQLPKIYRTSIEPAFNGALEGILNRFPEIEGYLEDIFTNINNSIFSFVTSASTTVVGMITGFAGQIPSLLINFLFTIVSSFFFTIDYHKIAIFIMRQFSKEHREMIYLLKNNGFGTLGKFLKAYSILIFITFIELSIGFSLLGISNSILIASLVAVVDILPILGTGTILIPWTILAFMFGKTSFGIGMLVLYITITVVRQTLEPKVVGQQIGLHPIVTLICMFVGAQLLGVLGLFMLPVTATILKKLNDEGTINLFR